MSTSPFFGSAHAYTHAELEACAATARTIARTTKSPAIRAQFRRDAKVYHAELDCRFAEAFSQRTADQIITRYGNRHAAALARAILNEATGKEEATP